jgi:hypothetical protein
MRGNHEDMDLAFDIAMFIFMTLVIVSQYYTIKLCSERINKLAKEVGVRYATEKSKTNLINRKLTTIANQRGTAKALAYMKGELQIHRDGVTSSCEATFKPRVVR